MKTLQITLLALVALVLTALPARAQVIVDNTTLTAAVTTTGQGVIQLNAVTCTGCTFGPETIVYVVGLGGKGSREAMVVTGQYAAGGGSKVVPVRRGQFGTVATVHVNASVVYVGPATRFHLATLATPGGGDPAGNCTRATQPFLPWINLLTGNIWNCDGSGNWSGINSARLTYNSSGPLGAQ